MVVFCATHLCLRSLFRAAVSVIAGLVVLLVTYLKVRLVAFFEQIY